MPGLTAIVTTLDEAQNIADCLDSLAFAQEVLVIDSFSTDGTAEVARSHGARVVQHEYRSPADQKNWAIPQAANEWVLILDADERVPESLAAEIGEAVRAASRDGYQIRRRNFFLGREIRHSGWQNDWVLRLFRRDKGRCLERQVHERLVVDGEVGRLRERLLHHSYRSMDDYWKKLERYASWNAAEARKRGVKVSTPYMLLHPALRFLKAYLLQGGILDGKAGLVVCLLTALYAAAKDVHIWEMQEKGESGRPRSGDPGS